MSDLIERAKKIKGDTPEERWIEANTVLLLLTDALEQKDEQIAFLKGELEQLANFNPEWDRLQAAQSSLREHMAEIARLREALYRIAWPENNNSRNAENKLAREALQEQTDD